MTEARAVCCPYCGESYETTIDASAGDQDYIEDCYVCCRPIRMRLMVDLDGNVLALEVEREHD